MSIHELQVTVSLPNLLQAHLVLEQTGQVLIKEKGLTKTICPRLVKDAAEIVEKILIQ